MFLKDFINLSVLSGNFNMIKKSQNIIIVMLPAEQERKKIRSMQVYDILNEELHLLSSENKDPGESINKIHIIRKKYQTQTI